MAELATLARPYANAVYELAKSNDRVDTWSGALGLLVELTATEQVQQLLGLPVITHMQKAHVLNELLDDRYDQPDIHRFVAVLSENQRLDLLADIAELFEVRRAEDSRVMDVTISSAVSLTDAEEEAFKEALRRRFDREVVVTLEVDSSLLGGAFIRAGDTVFDGSVRGKLQKMQEALSRA